jgi:predicted site-specific integrase-resolvase
MVAHLANPPGTNSRETREVLYRLAEVCSELQIKERTFREWRAKGRAPRCIRLPNGQLRVTRTELDRWLAEHEEVA